MRRLKIFSHPKMTPPLNFRQVLKSGNAYALIGVIVLSGLLSLSAIQGLKRSATRRAAIESMKAKFEQKAFFRQISKRLYDFHACGATLNSGGSITAIKNHAGTESFEIGKRYGRGYVSFDALNLSISGNTAELAVTASRYDKRKKETRGSMKKNYQLTLVRGPSSIDGCYIKDAPGTVSLARENNCQGIHTANWNGTHCELGPPKNQKCPAGKALRATDTNGNFECCEVQWKPDHRKWCQGVEMDQATECRGGRTNTGTLASSWAPDPGTVCDGVTFTQTEQCCRGRGPNCDQRTQQATGSMCCDCGCDPGLCPSLAANVDYPITFFSTTDGNKVLELLKKAFPDAGPTKINNMFNNSQLSNGVYGIVILRPQNSSVKPVDPTVWKQYQSKKNKVNPFTVHQKKLSEFNNLYTLDTRSKISYGSEAEFDSKRLEEYAESVQDQLIEQELEIMKNTPPIEPPPIQTNPVPGQKNCQKRCTLPFRLENSSCQCQCDTAVLDTRCLAQDKKSNHQSCLCEMPTCAEAKDIYCKKNNCPGLIHRQCAQDLSDCPPSKRVAVLKNSDAVGRCMMLNP